jgi:hypothetical protein
MLSSGDSSSQSLPSTITTAQLPQTVTRTNQFVSYIPNTPQSYSPNSSQSFTSNQPTTIQTFQPQPSTQTFASLISQTPASNRLLAQQLSTTIPTYPAPLPPVFIFLLF